jgi:phospholipid/cholesterol/gamma-HCH transport system substrate-binding protein
MNRRYLAAIGLTVIAALALVVRALLFLHPSPGDGSRRIQVRFQNVDKISSGTRVTFAGKPVGEVVIVQLLPEVFDIRAQDARPIYSYEVILAIDSSVRVYKSDEICVRSEGLMGERVIAITPKPVPEGGELRLIGPTDIVFAAPSGSAEEMLREITIFAQKADVTVETLGQASAQLNTLLTTLNNGHFGEKLSAIGDKSIACLENIDTLTTLLTTTAKGQGSLGMLMRDPSLYDTLLQCSSRTNQMIADINTYGVLFHTNRDWQREMHRRADEIAAFSSLTLQQSARERFVKISQIMSELRSTCTQADRTLDRGRLCEDQALREEFSEGLKTVQQQLNNLSLALQEASPDTASDVADEERDK